MSLDNRYSEVVRLLRYDHRMLLYLSYTGELKPIVIGERVERRKKLELKKLLTRRIHGKEAREEHEDRPIHAEAICEDHKETSKG